MNVWQYKISLYHITFAMLTKW